MDKVRALVREVRAYCKANADPGQAANYSRYFKEGYDGWGLMGKKDHPYWNQQQEEWLEKYGGLGLRGFLRAGELLFESGKYEEGALAIRMLARHRGEIDAEAFQRLGRWFAGGIRNWAHTDVLCGQVITPLLESGQVEMAALGSWRKAEWAYQRRAVPVAMLGLLPVAKDVRPLLRFLRPMMLDSERVVHQGLGWFLREAWKKQPKRVEAFLLEWKDDAPRLIFQYATEKMPAEDRARFRRQKKA